MTRVKKGDGVKKEVTNLKKTKTCTGPELADEVAADGSEEYSKEMLIRVVWKSADNGLADESDREKGFGFYQNSDDSVNI